VAKNCTDLRENRAQKDGRIDAMLREMVVLEGMKSLEEARPPRGFTMEEIGDFVGVSLWTVERIEREALQKIKKQCYDGE